MTLRQILESASERVTLLPALSSIAISELQARLGIPLPGDFSELLAYSGGLDLARGNKIRFEGFSGFVFADALPRSIALMHDDNGNYWAIAVSAITGDFGPIFFVSHDPPVIAIYADDPNGFLSQILASNTSASAESHGSLVDSAVRRIWKHDSWLRPLREAQADSDPILYRSGPRRILRWREMNRKALALSGKGLYFLGHRAVAPVQRKTRSKV